MENALRSLPVRLPPYPDELLSSWISRHAAFYAVPPLVMLRHCLPEVASLRAADVYLDGDQIVRLAKIFSADPAAVRRMTFGNVLQSSHRLIAAGPVQFCKNCSPNHTAPTPTLRSQSLGWRITCPLCGDQLRGADGSELPSPFRQYHSAARRGERLLDDEAERGVRTWASPSDIARLLLMRRVPRYPSRDLELWRFRVLGVIITDLDDILAAEQESMPTPARPIVSLHLRPALLAGVGIVEHVGPEIFRMLRGHMMCGNRARFSNLAEKTSALANQNRTFSQMQLI